MRKLHIPSRVDLNLQRPAAEGSLKIEIEDIPPEHLPSVSLRENETASVTKPSAHTLPSRASPPINPNRPITSSTTDPYLSSLLSSSPKSAIDQKTAAPSCDNSPNCRCFKCQRQRRWADIHKKTIPVAPANAPLTRSSSVQLLQSNRNVHPTASSTSHSSSPTHPSSPLTTLRKSSSICLRKTPSLQSYNRHLPRPVYSEADSIYPVDLKTMPSPTEVKKPPSTTSNEEKKQGDDAYQISWKDDSGNDLLSSLRTFQYIFDEKTDDNPEGLSDLLEERAKELRIKSSKKHEQEEPKLPPPREDCLTLSYRSGPPHQHLTLYHTMKMKKSPERTAAYVKAFNHCVKANSGMSGWIQRQRAQEPPKMMSAGYVPLYPKKHTQKRSLFHPMAKKNKLAEDLWFRTTSSSIADSAQRTAQQEPPTSIPMDVLSAAHALLPNNSVPVHQIMNRTDKAQSYSHIDTPRPPQQSRNDPQTCSVAQDASSISSGSIDESSATKSLKASRFFSSLSRRSLWAHSESSTSIHSLEKVKQPNLHQRKRLGLTIANVGSHAGKSTDT
ncbi:uncharacterized protein BYT42DRAFT_569373 [Radiomyces spectabilis]|uniref:uncharacterized protein n=1 Tax=Radiomyces spectabilis TaxID=64574 RepID=UPI00221F4F54|nr:uncharacterized protein BYT42DRAFT_569373 [Radiomyces spectabilis]KAI8379604.1 hypothetical protein BYT42DRAFT_569373 [Radiomyces spectabilis]